MPPARGQRLVGVIRYSDFPAAARALPVVGDAHAIDFERIVQLNPTWCWSGAAA